jgi:hypothetical protein
VSVKAGRVKGRQSIRCGGLCVLGGEEDQGAPHTAMGMELGLIDVIGQTARQDMSWTKRRI